jgi:hypothetical protein
MGKRLAADNGQKQSGERAVEQEWEWGGGCKCGDCGILLEYDLVVQLDNSTPFISRINE